ncbi:MAG: LOG family protein [Bauldia sp.]
MKEEREAEAARAAPARPPGTIPLADPDLRGPRLEIDYLGVELALRRHQIDETIVVFGSARIPEPEVAAQRLAVLEKLAAEHPDRDLSVPLAAAGKQVAQGRYYDEARAFGRLVGRAGRESGHGRLAVMTGGGGGIMEAANRGAHDVGAPSVGLNILLPQEQQTNRFISKGLGFEMRYFAIRKLHLLLRAKALVAFPGGFGTLDELFETLNLIQTGRIDAMPVVLVGSAFWNRVFDIDFLIDEGMISRGDRSLLRYAETAQEAWDRIVEWYAATGLPFLGDGGVPIRPASEAMPKPATGR